ncbi:hypothetical protein TIFTF001_055314 [Ficus carica]|uniref:Uncharacterized protein n=1 Tax=Ficus carica TaxID=3494 RepID=A0AA88EGZ3_FICCA|nr:hypothetical protein TIFTF001_055311 [Ficus carica]GMN73056.1 hypothetical protein TIFTF001_055312 [Ficus carica]GMN73060.1 hypothetical protein TIFTF001_055313 [Ficus carica]GMN73065.1 hypothetical protein TIFTF001_055314 [Ficus carica]
MLEIGGSTMISFILRDQIGGHCNLSSVASSIRAIPHGNKGYLLPRAAVMP